MLLAHAKGDVLQQLAEHEGYRLVVTGHSLGGGEDLRHLRGPVREIRKGQFISRWKVRTLLERMILYCNKKKCN